MSFADRLFAGLKTIVLLDDRLTALSHTVKDLKSTTDHKLSSHESRLTRLETIIEITRPDAPTLRLPPP